MSPLLQYLQAFNTEVLKLAHIAAAEGICHLAVALPAPFCSALVVQVVNTCQGHRCLTLYVVCMVLQWVFSFSFWALGVVELSSVLPSVNRHGLVHVCACAVEGGRLHVCSAASHRTAPFPAASHISIPSAKTFNKGFHFVIKKKKPNFKATTMSIATWK